MDLKGYKLRVKLIDVAAFFLGGGVGLVLLRVDLLGLLGNDINWLNIALLLFPISLFFVIGKGTSFRPPSLLCNLLLVAIGIVNVIVNEMSTAIAMVMLLFIYFVHFNLRRSTFSAYILGNSLAGLLLLARSVSAIVKGNAWQGNRVPLHITMIGLLCIYLLNESHFKKKWTYVLFAVLLVTDFLTRSRTALLSCFLAFVLQFVMDMRGRLTISKLVIGVLSLCLVLSGLYTYQDKIMELLLSKWGTAGHDIDTLTSGRTLLWLDVLSDIRLLGYGERYSAIKYNLQNMHNGYIQAYTSYGVVVGILYFLWKIVYMVKLVSLHKRPEASNMIITMIPLVFMNMFESSFLFDPSYPYMGYLDVMLMGRVFKIIESLNGNKIKHHRISIRC